jgi:hypothetical protein
MNYFAGLTLLGNRTQKKISGNTILYVSNENGEKVVKIKFHQTDIVTFYSDGFFKVNSDGYRTSTTKRRINDYTNLGLYQSKGIWYFGDKQEFRDNILEIDFKYLLNLIPENKKGLIEEPGILADYIEENYQGHQNTCDRLRKLYKQNALVV